MIVNEEEEGDIVFVTAEGALGEDPLYHLEEVMTRRAAGKAVLDLSRVTRINSQGVSFLLACLRRAQRSGGQFVLSGPRGRVNEVFDVTRLGAFIAIVSNRDAARQLLASAAPPGAPGNAASPKP